MKTTPFFSTSEYSLDTHCRKLEIQQGAFKFLMTNKGEQASTAVAASLLMKVTVFNTIYMYSIEAKFAANTTVQPKKASAYSSVHRTRTQVGTKTFEMLFMCYTVFTFSNHFISLALPPFKLAITP